MKLTAPPPDATQDPPSEPPPPASAPDAPETAVPFQKPPEKVATWPSWFGPADSFLAAIVVAMAFLAASFSARNSDIWLHLASGKRLTTGEYKLGTDPFSYTAADRTWVNHNWLFDFGAYLLYSGDGFLLSVVKALAVAIAFVLVLAIRRSGQPLWPWTVLTALGVLASATMFTLRPQIGSIVLLALTLLLVFRLPSPRGSWKLPLAIGGVFALWSNVDAWFVLGPAALLLLFVGEAIRKQVWPAAVPDEADPLGPLPDVATLGKALVVGTLACMLNPHHVGIWHVPFELLGAGEAGIDPRIRVLFNGPLKQFPLYLQEPSFGLNGGGIAYLLLLVCGIYFSFLSGVVGRFVRASLDVEPLPLPLMLLWVGVAALSLFTMYAIPFFAVVTIPLVASRFNVLSAQVRLGTWKDGGTRFLLTASTGGRMATALALLLACLVAWPGWLHSPASAWWVPGITHPANIRRVEWRVEADPDMVQAAEWLNAARVRGDLSPETRGFVSSLDMANHLAWFAPQEKVFTNGRIAFHKPELPEFAKARRGLGAFDDKGEAPDLRDTGDLLVKWKASYLAISWLRTEREPTRSIMRYQELMIWVGLDNWSPWFFNGRSAISGYRLSKAGADPSFDKLALDPVAIAYGSNVERLPAVKIDPPLLQQSAWDELFTSRKPSPASVEECRAWQLFKTRAAEYNRIRKMTGALLRLNQPGLAAPPIPQTLFLGRDEVMAQSRRLQVSPPEDGSFQTNTILGMRAARRAIAENPNHPDGYFALSEVLTDDDLPISQGERSVMLATAYQQCLARMPKPADYRRNFFIASPTDVARSLAVHYIGRQFPSGEFGGLRVDMGSIGDLAGGGIVYRIPPSPATGNRTIIARRPAALAPPGATQLAAGAHILPLDLAQQLLATAEEYAKVEFPDPERRSGELNRIAEIRKAVDASLKKALDQYRKDADRAPKLYDRHNLALAYGLFGEALNQLTNADLGKEFGEGEVFMFRHMIAMQLALGRLEDASGHLPSLRNFVADLGNQPTVPKDALKSFQTALSELEFHKLVLEGNYAEAGKEMESLEGGQIGIESILTSLAEQKIGPKNYKDYDTVAQRMDRLNVAWPLLPMLGIPSYGPGEPLSVLCTYALGRMQMSHFGLLVQARQQIADKMQRDSEFFYRRGFLSLVEGDIAGARARFASSYRPAPPGWSVPAVRHQSAEMFLKQIDAANKPK